jgi:hypothetical protein
MAQIIATWSVSKIGAHIVATGNILEQVTEQVTLSIATGQILE